MFRMQILLIRHAIAQSSSASGLDAERALTPEGRREFERIASALAALGLRPRLVLHSPWRRAHETAALLEARFQATCQPCPELAQAPSTELLGRMGSGDVALVGHEPWISALAAWLITGKRELAAGFPFERGGCALLEGRALPGEARLVAFLPPAMLSGLRLR
ncbi:MAG: phosphohistidine phosphatase [Planctomycetes bacterium]|nr:phosphohistidine phosphatase [Planctomycetota bacterium]